MRDWTCLELRTKVRQDLNHEDELFIDNTELNGYLDDAIDIAEAEIHKLGIEDLYFKDYEYLDLVSGTAEYEMPANIYANKLLGIVYRSGQTIYQVKRLRGSKHLLEIEEILEENHADPIYKYDVINRAGVGRRIVLFPGAKETSSTVMKAWFIRNATRMTADDSVLDIPEFANFIIQYAKVQCLTKEPDIRLAKAEEDLKRLRDLMIETLTEMVPDGDNRIEMDLTHYEEMS